MMINEISYGTLIPILAVMVLLVIGLTSFVIKCLRKRASTAAEVGIQPFLAYCIGSNGEEAMIWLYRRQKRYKGRITFNMVQMWCDRLDVVLCTESEANDSLIMVRPARQGVEAEYETAAAEIPAGYSIQFLNGPRDITVIDVGNTTMNNPARKKATVRHSHELCMSTYDLIATVDRPYARIPRVPLAPRLSAASP